MKLFKIKVMTESNRVVHTAVFAMNLTQAKIISKELFNEVLTNPVEIQLGSTT